MDNFTFEKAIANQFLHHFQTKGYKIFQLEFHLSYFAFRLRPQLEATSQGSPNIKAPLRWIDLSFLEIQTPKANTERHHGLYEAHISVVICGSDAECWTAYAFDDGDFDGENLYDAIYPYKGIHADPIASDGDVDAERPIWDPREYFLTVVAARMARVAEEWEALVRLIERSIREYVRFPAFSCLDYTFFLLTTNNLF